MGSTPRVSIVTPSFNQASFIEETILSVQNGGYSNIEHIVVDGGSTDDTISILKKYPHIRWISEPDKGQSDALNKGFAMATGEIIGWLNSDDCYYRNAIETVVETFVTHPNADFVYGNLAIIDEISDLQSLWKVELFDLECQLNDHNMIAQPAAFFTKKLLDQVGPINVSLRYTMDVDLWNRMALSGATMIRVNKVLALFREHGNSKTISEGSLFWKELRATSRFHGSRFYNTMLLRYLYEQFPGSRYRQFKALRQVIKTDRLWVQEYFGHI
jgi:glycosyltransferase involved in cell wall biosynthesis